MGELLLEPRGGEECDLPGEGAVGRGAVKCPRNARNALKSRKGECGDEGHDFVGEVFVAFLGKWVRLVEC